MNEDKKESDNLLTTNFIPKEHTMISIVDEEQEDEIFEQNRKMYTYSNPNYAQLRHLSHVRKLPFFRRLFRPMEDGSLRAVVIVWIRMTMGIGILTTPYYISSFGVLGGVLALLIGAILCLMSFRFIFEASVERKQKEFLSLISDLLPEFISRVFKYTFLLDLMIPLLSYLIISWNIFSYILYMFGLFHDDWVINVDTMEIDEYNKWVFLIRAGYFFLVFLFLIPLFMKKDLSSLRSISFVFLGVMVVFLIYIMVESPFFRVAYKRNDTLKVNYLIKPLEPYFIPNFFSMLLAFYIQPFVLTLRNEVISPTISRLRKISFYTILVEFLIYAVFGSICYLCFGDNYIPALMILRKPYEGKNYISEVIFKGGIVLFFILIVLGLSVFNPGIRDHALKFSTMKNKSLQYKLYSLVPFFIACLIGTLVPNIITVFWFFGLVVCNFNGFIIPVLLKIQLINLKGRSFVKLVLCYLLLLFYVLCGAFGVFVKLSGN